MSSASGGPSEGAPRRFHDALAQAQTDWAAADPARQAGRAGCRASTDGVVVPYFGRPLLVTHPDGGVSADGKAVHAAVAILVLHYLVRADGTPAAGAWLAFRDLPDGLFYAPSFAGRAEAPIAATFGGDSSAGRDLEAFRGAATAAGGVALDLADASFSFQALPLLRIATLLWEGDEDFPAEARIVFDAAAGHYLPAEDLAGLGEALTHRLTGGR